MWIDFAHRLERGTNATEGTPPTRAADLCPRDYIVLFGSAQEEKGGSSGDPNPNRNRNPEPATGTNLNLRIETPEAASHAAVCVDTTVAVVRESPDKRGNLAPPVCAYRCEVLIGGPPGVGNRFSYVVARVVPSVTARRKGNGKGDGARVVPLQPWGRVMSAIDVGSRVSATRLGGSKAAGGKEEEEAITPSSSSSSSSSSSGDAADYDLEVHHKGSFVIPARGDDFTVYALGDTGVFSAARAVYAAMVRAADGGDDPSLVLHSGDLAYADYGAGRWDTFARIASPITSRAIYMAAVGNHDGAASMRERWGYYGTPGLIGGLASMELTGGALGDYRRTATTNAGGEGENGNPGPSPSTSTGSAAGDETKGSPSSSSSSSAPTSSGAESSQPPAAETSTATAAAASANPEPVDLVRERAPASDSQYLWYSFISGPLFVAMLDSDSDVSPGSAQYTWLDSVLSASRNGAHSRILIVVAHVPMYTSSDGHRGVAYEASHRSEPLLPYERMRLLEPLLRKHGVSLFIAGDDHVYERTYPAWRGMTSVAIGAPVTRGSVSFPIEPSDGTVHAIVGTGGATLDKFVPGDPPGWSAKRVSAYGFMRIRVSSTWHKHHAICEFMELTGEDATSARVTDRFAVAVPRFEPFGTELPGAPWRPPILLVVASVFLVYVLLRKTGGFAYGDPLRPNRAAAQQQTV